MPILSGRAHSPAQLPRLSAEDRVPPAHRKRAISSSPVSTVLPCRFLTVARWPLPLLLRWSPRARPALFANARRLAKSNQATVIPFPSPRAHPLFLRCAYLAGANPNVTGRQIFLPPSHTRPRPQNPCPNFFECAPSFRGSGCPHPAELIPFSCARRFPPESRATVPPQLTLSPTNPKTP